MWALNNQKRTVLIFLFLMFPAELTGMSYSLQELCTGIILNNPRYYLEKNIEAIAHSLNLEEAMRTYWFAQHSTTTSSWFMQLVKSTIACPKKISSSSVGDVFEFNKDHTLLKTITLVDFGLHMEAIYDFQGNCLSFRWPFGSDPEFISEPGTSQVDQGFLDTWGISPGYRSSIRHAKINRDKKLVVWDESSAVIYDLAPCYRFLEYLKERVPLAQILVMQVLEHACAEKKKITLTLHEKKILDGIPPQFDAAKNFLKKDST